MLKRIFQAVIEDDNRVVTRPRVADADAVFWIGLAYLVFLLALAALTMAG